MAFAQITLYGNLGKDPEMKYTPGGKAVTEVSVAVNRPGKKDAAGDWMDMGTDWFRVTIWGERGEKVAETFSKGDKVVVVGRFSTREWEGREDGSKHTALEVSADRMEKVSPRKGAEDDDTTYATPAPAAARPKQREPAADDNDLDDLPF